MEWLDWLGCETTLEASKDGYCKRSLYFWIDIANHNLLRIVFGGLQVYRAKRREKQLEKDGADGISHQNTLKGMFKSWRKMYFYKFNQRSAIDLARYMESQSYKSRYFCDWIVKFLISKKSKESDVEAEKIYSKMLLSKSFLKWFVVARKRSMLQYTLCISH